MGNQRNQGYRRQNDVNFKSKFQENWITEKINKAGIDFADEFGRYIASDGRGMTTSQIRNFFGEVKRIQLKGYTNLKEQTSFLLLKPKLAYAAKRANKRETTKFREIMEMAHNSVEEGNLLHFQNYVDFLEAILAYHKTYGGRE